MSNFAQKVKLEQRHELYTKNLLPLTALRSRPNFLSNDSLMPNTAQLNDPSIRPKSNYGDSPRKFESKKGKKENSDIEEGMGIPSKSSLDNFYTEGTQNELNNENSRKTMMRRRSCCCKWCGGASKFEMKHNDLTEAKREEAVKIPTIGVSLTPILPERIILPSQRASVRISTKVSSKVNSPSVRHDMAISKLFGNESTKFNERASMLFPTEVHPVSSFAPPESSKSRTQRSPKLIVRTEGFKITEQLSVRDLKETEPDSPDKAGPVIRPVKLKKELSLTSVRFRTLEKTFSKPDLGLQRTQSNIVMPSGKAGVQTTVLQKMFKDISGQNASSAERLAKLTMPMSSPLVEKIKARNMNLNSLQNFERDLSNSRTKDSPTLRGFYKPKPSLIYGSRVGDDEFDESTEPECQSATKLYFDSESPRKIKSRIVNSQRNVTSFQTTRAKIIKVYIDDKNGGGNYNKSVTYRKKEESPSGRMLETPNILHMSSIKTEPMKTSMTENSREYERNEGKDEIKSTGLKKIKKKKNERSKERKLQWLVNNFSMQKNSSLGSFPPLVNSVQHRRPKEIIE